MIDGPQRDEDLGIEAVEGDTEEIDAIPVPAGEGTAIAPLASTSAPQHVMFQSLASLRSAPVVQAAAVAAGGFVAGAAVVGLARRRQDRLARGGRMLGGSRGERRGKGSRQGGLELLQIVGSRSLLVDVHLLGARQR